ncbi:RNA polymerase sigma factor [Paenibacillus sp. GCM10027626]|uniref:RNA polymerase sigma factor n=1 Tax=Paenibacillus sp. GCM10027626 TaxID=3273411 RepID=UPI00363037AE
MSDYNEVAERYVNVLFRYCLALTHSVWEAEDLVQETCLRAMPIIVGERKHNNPVAFLIRTAKNIWTDEARRQSRAAALFEQMSDRGVHHDEHYFEADSVLKELMQHLSPLQLTVFLLREVFGFSAPETSHWLEMTEGAVKSALHRARRAICRFRQGERAAKEADDGAWAQAYLAAFRESDPAALVYLTMVQNQLVTSVEAIGMMNNQMAANRTATSSFRMQAVYAA